MYDRNCERKKRYPDEESAMAELAKIQRKLESGYWLDGERPKAESRAYWCWDCRGWHLTSKGTKPWHGRKRRSRR